jgi:hypothetical protein
VTNAGAAPTFRSDARAAEQLRAALDKTLTASSFNETVNIQEKSGPESERYVYNAPDKLEIFNVSASQPSVIVVGGTEYHPDSPGSGWTGVHNQRPGEAKTTVLGYLSQLLKSRSVKRVGQSFTAITYSRGWPLPNDANEEIARLQVSKGFVSQDRLVVHSDDANWPGETVTLKFSDIDTSPVISAPP